MIRIITTETFNLEDLLSKTGVPKYEWEVTNEFISCVQKILPDVNIYGHPIYKYYTIDKTEWERIGLSRQGDAKLRLVINDPNYFHTMPFGQIKWGRDFYVYLGEEDHIHQMIAHDFFIEQEIEAFIDFFDNKLKNIIEYQERLKIDFGGVIAPIWRIYAKYQMWNRVKETMRSIYSIRDLTEKGKLLSTTIKSTIEKKCAYINVPRQIWILGEKKDPEEKIQYSVKHFFEIRVDDSKFQNTPELPINPLYHQTSQRLPKTVDYVSDQVKEIYERDLLTAYQTEFSMYAVWFSLIAIIIALISLII